MLSIAVRTPGRWLVFTCLPAMVHFNLYGVLWQCMTLYDII
jgi:hypothetical protein